MPDLDPAIAAIVAARAGVATERSVLVAVSGIDGAGKGFVARRLADALDRLGLRVALLAVDGWLRLPGERFDASDPAGHFYRRAIRFEEMFARLVLPLREGRSVRVEVAHAEETATAYEKRTYEFGDVDVILLEGIFLLKREHRGHFDLALWVDCTFETALTRAIARAQEGLSPEETARANRTTYVPAQQIHMLLDDPTAGAIIIDNDRG